MNVPTPTQRPAEFTAAAAAIALLIARALGVDDADVIAAVAVVIGFIPSIVTWIVDMTRSNKANA